MELGLNMLGCGDGQLPEGLKYGMMMVLALFAYYIIDLR